MNKDKSDFIAAETAVTLAGLFRERVKRSPNKLAYRQFDQDTGQWCDSTWQEMATEVARWQDALANEGLQHGDRVAVLLRNCKEWVTFDQAALGCGLVMCHCTPMTARKVLPTSLTIAAQRFCCCWGKNNGRDC